MLADYDAGVRAFKAARGHNVTLQLDDPLPEFAKTWTGVPLATAAGWVRERLAAEPGHPSARIVLAQLEGRQGRSAQAAAALEEHVARHPKDAAGWNALGVASARLSGKTAAARKLECYGKATELDARNASAWANLGNARAAAGQPAEAVAAGLVAVSIQPHYVYAWMNLGIAYGMLKDPVREKDAYRRAIEVPPDFEKCPFARFNLALCFEQDKRYADAVRWYSDALAVGLPQGPRSRHAALFHHNLARALYFHADYPEAAREATAALKIDESLPEPYSLLGHLFEKAGKPEMARRAYVRATALLKKHGPSLPDAPLRHAE